MSDSSIDNKKDRFLLFYLRICRLHHHTSPILYLVLRSNGPELGTEVMYDYECIKDTDLKSRDFTSTTI